MSQLNDLATGYQRIVVEPYTPNIGATIRDIDLSRPLDGETRAELAKALAEFEVLFFRRQHLDPDQHVEFARVFGNVEDVKAFFPRHPAHAQIEIIEHDDKRSSKGGTDQWHADITWVSNPPIGAALYARQVPAVGGDTLWASATKVYETLPAGLRAHLETLTAIHSFEQSNWPRYLRGLPDGEARYAEARAKFPPVEHPVVRVHPVTGKKLIYVNPVFTQKIKDVGREESDALLGLLYRQFQRPDVQARLRWENDTIAVWDNRATQHYAVADYFPQYRLMHRITISAETAF